MSLNLSPRNVGFRVIALLGLWLMACEPIDHQPKTIADITNAETASHNDAAPQSEPISFGATYQLKSDIYNEMREVNIYVPEIPEWGQGYFADPLPVLYVVDGGAEQDFFHIAALSQLTLINAERQPMIVVGIRTHNRRSEIMPAATDPRYKGGEFANWGGSDDFKRHILGEVKPFVEARHKVGRSAIIGESLAGLFIAELCLKTPESFDDYISISPSLWWDDQRLAKDAAELLSRHTSSGKRLYLTMADEGGTMRQGLDKLIQALSVHEDAVEVNFVDRAETDTHGSIYHHAARDALIWLHGIPAEPYGETPWYFKTDGQPPVPN